MAKTRLAIVTDADSATAAEKDALTSYLTDRGWDVWHWFSDLWLVTGVPHDIDIGTMLDEIRSEVGNIHLFIFRMPASVDAGAYGKLKSLKWLNEKWSGSSEI